MGFARKHLSTDGLYKIVKHSVLREKFKKIKNTEYSWHDCIMSGLAVFGFKMPSLLQFEKDKASEPWIRRNLRTLYGVEQAPSDTCMRERLDIVSPPQLRQPFKVLIVEDGLAYNFPHLSMLDSLNRQYVIGVKPGDHKYLFNWIKDLKPMVHQHTDDVGTQHELHVYTEQLRAWLLKLMLRDDYAHDALVSK